MHNDTSREAAWFYAEDGDRHGSLDEAQMIELIRAGRLGGDTPVWKIGYTDWRLLDDSELRPHLDALSPDRLRDRHAEMEKPAKNAPPGHLRHAPSHECGKFTADTSGEPAAREHTPC